MITTKNIIISAAYYCCFLSLFASSASANERDKLFSPYTHAQLQYDDNVFLLSDQESPAETIGSNQQSDFVLSVGAGFRTQITHLKQRYSVDAKVFQREHDRFNNLEFTGGGLNAKWDWALNRKWSGVISYDFVNDQSGFLEQRLTAKDSFDSNRFEARAKRKLTARSHVYLAGLYQDKEYEQRDILDNETSQVLIGYEYGNAKKESLGVEVGTSRGRYTNRFALTPDDPVFSRFDEDVAKIKTRWQISPKTRLNAELGYVSRKHNRALSEFDFDGLIYDLRLRWNIGARTELASGYRRRLNNTENTQSLFTIDDRLLLELRWAASNRLGIVATAARRDIEFTQRLGGTRDDDVYTIKLKSIYKINRLFDIEFILQDQSRDSNNFINEFDKATASISILYNAGTEPRRKNKF